MTEKTPAPPNESSALDALFKKKSEFLFRRTLGLIGPVEETAMAGMTNIEIEPALIKRFLERHTKMFSRYVDHLEFIDKPASEELEKLVEKLKQATKIDNQDIRKLRTFMWRGSSPVDKYYFSKYEVRFEAAIDEINTKYLKTRNPAVL